MPSHWHRAHPVACRPPYRPDSKYQCGVFEVPLDYHDASAGNGQIYYARLPATEGVRKGTIFVDPGNCCSPMPQRRVIVYSACRIVGFPSATVLDLSPPVWLLMKGEALHNRTSGEYDVVVWNARGKGNPAYSLTVYVVRYIALSAQ